jgi:hypothetical protein
LNTAVTFDDVRRLVLKCKSKILMGCACGAIVLLAIGLSQKPTYLAEATFKEGVEQSTPDTFMKDMFLNGLKASQQSQAISIMKSARVLQPVVELYGLQAQILDPFAYRVIGRIQDLFCAEFGLIARKKNEFHVSNVIYSGPVRKKLQIKFLDSSRFVVLDQSNKIADGVVGQAVKLGFGYFTCARVPQNLKFNRAYSFVLTPLMKTIKDLRSNLSIRPQKVSKSIYEMQLLSSDRQLGAVVLNSIMDSHRAYLKGDHDETAKEQIAYLEKKKNHLYAEISQLFDQHSHYLRTVIEDKGFVGLDHEMGSYSRPYEGLKDRLFALDLELNRLSGVDPISSYPQFAVASEKIKELVAQKGQLPARCELTASLELPGLVVDELDLVSSKRVLSETLLALDASKSKIRNLEALSLQISSPDCDLSSLSPFLMDSMSQHLLEVAREASHRVGNSNHYSKLEVVRAKDELRLQKKRLGDHLSQMKQLEEISLETLRQKKESVESVVYRCIDREILSINGQVEASIIDRKQALLEERSALKHKMDELRVSASGIPERWKSENWLEVKLDLSKKIMTMMTQLVESKTVERHLHAVESKPLDIAVDPINLQPPHLLLLTAIGGLLGAFIVFSCFSMDYLSRGFPLTARSLKANRLALLGAVDSELDAMRSIFSVIKGNRLIALFGGSGPDYSQSLALYLRGIGRKVLVIRCDGDVNPLYKGSFYDWLQTKDCSTKLAQADCDHVLFWQASPFKSYQTRALLAMSHQSIVTINGERLEDLTMFFDKPVAYVVPGELL